MKESFVAPGVTLWFCLAGVAHALVDNGSFEAASYCGWETTGHAVRTDSSFGIGPVHGASQALITTGGNTSRAAIEHFLGIEPGTLDTFTAYPATAGTALRQSLTVEAGRVLSFDWNFLCNDYVPYNDFAFFSVNGEVHKLSDVAECDGLGNGNASFQDQTGFSSFSYTFSAAGTYTIGFGVIDVRDTSVAAGLIIDNVHTDEPLAVVKSSMVLMPYPRSYVLEDYDLDAFVSFDRSVCDPASARIVAISSDEPATDPNHDCSVYPAYCVHIEIVDQHRFRVRNNRATYGDGRVYTVHFEILDNAGLPTGEIHSGRIGVRLWREHVPSAGAPAYTIYP
jgi:hypothetical protein